MVGGASVYTSTGSPIAHIPPEEEFVTGKKQHKKRVVAILRFHIFVIVGLADGRAKFFSWADRDSLGRTRVIDKKDCGGNFLKASNDVSPVLAYSPELRYVSYTKPFVDTLRAFLSVEHSGQSVGFKRTIPRLRGIANFVKFLEEADIDHKMPFPVEMVHNLTKAMSDYMQLKLDEVGYDVQIRMEHNVRNAISLLCSIDTATIPLVLTPGFPTDTYLNEFPTHSKMILDQKMYRPNPSLDDDKHPKNFLWSLLKKLYNDYIDISNALENIDVFMSSVGKDNPLANASIVKIYGRYVQILQDIKETAWMISQIIGLKEKDRWYYGGGLYMGKKMPDFSSENPNVPRIEYPLTLN
ncbi:Ribosome control protein 1 domain-containing protein [Entamoeba marina]